jgi:hypothetical protein
VDSEVRGGDLGVGSALGDLGRDLGNLIGLNSATLHIVSLVKKLVRNESICE